MFLKFFGKKPARIEEDSPEESEQDYGIDCELNYCPSCGDEFRAEISHCRSCDMPLISGREKLEKMIGAQQLLGRRSMAISPEDDLVAIRKGPLKDMKYLQKLLGQERIPAILAGDTASCGRGCCGPELFLQIKKEDLSTAMEILAREFVRSTALDSHDLSNAQAVFDVQAAETVCPACGCKFSPTVGACPDCGLCFE